MQPPTIALRSDQSVNESHILRRGAAVTARSFHEGLVNVVRMDGSAGAVSDSVELNAWRAATTRRGREVQNRLE